MTFFRIFLLFLFSGLLSCQPRTWDGPAKPVSVPEKLSLKACECIMDCIESGSIPIEKWLKEIPRMKKDRARLSEEKFQLRYYYLKARTDMLSQELKAGTAQNPCFREVDEAVRNLPPADIPVFERSMKAHCRIFAFEI